MRTLAPADSLIYLETNDLAAALQPIVDSTPFNEVAQYKPDFSALKGVQLAVAVTGFETSEEKIDDEQSVGRVQPHFVAIADTHAWNFRAVAFAEKKLGSFVENIYNSQPTLEKIDKHGGKYFTWTAADGDKAHALVIDSVIYFANDESSIEKCLAVRSGESLNLAQSEKVRLAEPQTLASGFVSTDGVAQIANIVGLQLASQASDEPEVQSAIAEIVPRLLRNSVTTITWTANKAEQGIEDRYGITLTPSIAKVLHKTLVPATSGPTVEVLAPTTASSVTRYGLIDPAAAWRSLLLTAQKQTDPLVGQMITELSTVFFQPYGIAEPEMFLESATSKIITARLDDEGDKLVVIAGVGDYAKMKRSISDEIDFSMPPLNMKGEEMWQSKDGTLAFARHMGFVLIGEPADIEACIDAEENYLEHFRQFDKNESPAVTIVNDTATAAGLADVLSEKKSDDIKAATRYTTETRFTTIGMDRKTTSDFGLIGSIIAQLGQD